MSIPLISDLSSLLSDFMSFAPSPSEIVAANDHTLLVRDKISLIAVGISIISALVSYRTFRQKDRDSSYTLRKQLSDTIQKLMDLNQENAKFRMKPNDYPENYGGLIGDQRRFHSRMAIYYVNMLKYRVSRWELQLIGTSLAALQEFEIAEEMFKKSLKIRGSIVEDATVLRGYGRFAFERDDLTNGRRRMWQAIEKLNSSEGYDFEVGFTYERWAEMEWLHGNQSMTYDLLGMAAKAYDQDRWVHRSDMAIRKLSESDTYKNAAQARKIYLDLHGGTSVQQTESAT